MKIKLTILFLLIVISSLAQTDSLKEIKNLQNQTKFKEVIDLTTKRLKSLKETDSLYKELMELRVISFMRLSDFKSAIDDWKALLSIDSLNMTYILDISFAYWSIGDYENNLKILNRAYKIKPNDVEILNNLASTYGELDKYNESIKYANMGFEQHNIGDTTKALLLNNRGYAYIGLKKYKKALIDINKSIALYPTNSFAYYYRALANIGQAKFDTVCQDLEQSKKLGGVNMSAELIEKYCKK